MASVGGVEAAARLAARAATRGKPAVLTAAFESGVAHAHLALAAAAFGGASVAHGLSTHERLAEDALEPPFAELFADGDLVDVGRAQAALDATADRLNAS